MAVDAYIRSAISQLHDAAAALQREASELQRELDRQKTQHQNELQKAQAQRKLHEGELLLLHDDGERRATQARIDSLAQTEQQHADQIAQLEANNGSTVNDKNGAVGKLTGAAQQLEGLLRLPGIQ